MHSLWLWWGVLLFCTTRWGCEGAQLFAIGEGSGDGLSSYVEPGQDRLVSTWSLIDAVPEYVHPEHGSRQVLRRGISLQHGGRQREQHGGHKRIQDGDETMRPKSPYLTQGFSQGRKPPCKYWSQIFQIPRFIALDPPIFSNYVRDVYSGELNAQDGYSGAVKATGNTQRAHTALESSSSPHYHHSFQDPKVYIRRTRPAPTTEESEPTAQLNGPIESPPRVFTYEKVPPPERVELHGRPSLPQQQFYQQLDEIPEPKQEDIYDQPARPRQEMYQVFDHNSVEVPPPDYSNSYEQPVLPRQEFHHPPLHRDPESQSDLVQSFNPYDSPLPKEINPQSPRNDLFLRKTRFEGATRKIRIHQCYFNPVSCF